MSVTRTGPTTRTTRRRRSLIAPPSLANSPARRQYASVVEARFEDHERGLGRSERGTGIREGRRVQVGELPPQPRSLLADRGPGGHVARTALELDRGLGGVLEAPSPRGRGHCADD